MSGWSTVESDQKIKGDQAVTSATEVMHLRRRTFGTSAVKDKQSRCFGNLIFSTMYFQFS